MRITTAFGRNIFALGIIGLAILGFIYHDFIIGRPPKWPESLPINPGLAYLSNGVVIIAGIAIVLNRKIKSTALLMAAATLLFSMSRHLSSFAQDWLNTYKTLAVIGGCLIVTASAEANNKRSNQLTWTGSGLLAIFFVASGYAHFKFADFVTGFIPAYIPFHVFFYLLHSRLSHCGRRWSAHSGHHEMGGATIWNNADRLVSVVAHSPLFG